MNPKNQLCTTLQRAQEDDLHTSRVTCVDLRPVTMKLQAMTTEGISPANVAHSYGFT